MNCLIIVGSSLTGRRESEVKIRIRTYSDSITSVHQGAGGIKDYNSSVVDPRDCSKNRMTLFELAGQL